MSHHARQRPGKHVQITLPCASTSRLGSAAVIGMPVDATLVEDKQHIGCHVRCRARGQFIQWYLRETAVRT